MQDIKQQAINHYQRMIAWAEKQDQKSRPSAYKMKYSIKENWFSDYCSYCKEYQTDCSNCLQEDAECKSCEVEACKKCVLYKNNSCCNGLWVLMRDSFSWAEWVKTAKKVLDYIKANG